MKIYFGSNKNGKYTFFFIFMLVFALMIMIGVYTLISFKPVFEQKASHAAKIRATEVINSAINEVFDTEKNREYVSIISSDNGNVTSVSANTSEMNRLRSQIAVAIQNYTSKNENSIIYIPIGSLTGYPVLQGMGYKIPVKIVLDGISNVDFDDEFIQAGINQVKHKIYLTASAEFSVISSVMTANEKVDFEIPVTETVIVGSVPNYYGDKLGVVGK